MKLFLPVGTIVVLVSIGVFMYILIPKIWTPSRRVLSATTIKKILLTNTPTPTLTTSLAPKQNANRENQASSKKPTPTIVQFTPTPVPTLTTSSPTNVMLTATPTPYSSVPSFSIESIDAMKDTKDAVCGQRSVDWINQWLSKAVELGANYVAISTPYDNPSCGDSLSYTKVWVNAIRAHGLKIWHRHMPLSFEGLYNTAKNSNTNYLDLIKNYILNNPDIFQNDDIFTPIPEPQSGGIQGVTYCANSLCQFSSKEAFNQWLRDAMTVSQQAFQSIGREVKIGYFGFDGFVAWGDHNPDWHGILDDATVEQMGNITIDHYPESVGETMDQGLTELQAKYPSTPIVIGEWGTITGGDVNQQVIDDMTAAKNHHIVGFNYWQFGPSGAGEQLINSDFSERSSFYKVQSFYK